MSSGVGERWPATLPLAPQVPVPGLHAPESLVAARRAGAQESSPRGATERPPPLGEVKTLMIQLLRGVKHLHDNWILHRDLKTSNLLLSHAGILKVSPLPAKGHPAPGPRPQPAHRHAVLAGGRLWAGARVWVPSEGLHPGGRDPVVPCPRAAAWC